MISCGEEAKQQAEALVRIATTTMGLTVGLEDAENVAGHAEVMTAMACGQIQPRSGAGLNPQGCVDAARFEPLPGRGLTWICELDFSTRCMDLGDDPRDVRGASNGSVVCICSHKLLVSDVRWRGG